jgi:hypothetical protein
MAQKNKIIKIITIIIDSIFCLLFPLSIVAAMVSPMVFDAPGSTENFYNHVFFYANFTLPILILISVITSIILLKSKSYKKALVFSLLPTINFVVILFVFSFGH